MLLALANGWVQVVVLRVVLGLLRDEAELLEHTVGERCGACPAAGHRNDQPAEDPKHGAAPSERSLLPPVQVCALRYPNTPGTAPMRAPG